MIQRVFRVRRNFFLFFFLLFLSFFSLAAEEKTSVGKNPPQWINNPQKNCFLAREICAVGVGDGPMQAEYRARREVAKVLNTKIQSSLNHHKSLNTSANFLNSSEGMVKEDFKETLKEESKAELVGVSIRARYQSQTQQYALAVLDKRKYAEQILRKITSLDEALILERERGNKGRMALLWANYKERKKLNGQYLFLTGKEHPEKITFEEILKLQQSTMKNTLPLYLELRETDLWEGWQRRELQASIEKILLEEGQDLLILPNSLSEEERKKIKFIKISVDFETHKEFLKVENFEKYRFLVSLKSILPNNRVKGQYTFNSRETGRSKEDAQRKLLEKFKSDFKKRVSELLP